MHSAVRLAAGATVLAACAVAAAEPLPATGALSLDDAVRIAHERNPDYRALQYALSLAALDLESARSVFRSQFTSRFDTSDRTGAMLGSTYELGVSKLSETGNRWGVDFTSSQFGDRALSELRLSYRLPFFGNPAADSLFAVDSAEIAVERHRRMLMIGSEELTARVVELYYGVVLAANAVMLERGSANVADALERAVAIKLGAGTASEADLRRAGLRAVARRRAVQVAELALDRSSMRLAVALGLPDESRLIVDDTIPDGRPEENVIPPLAQLERRALARRPELIALAAEIALLERKVDTHEPRRVPPLDVNLQVSLVGEGRRSSDTFDRYEPTIGIGFGMALGRGRDADLKHRRLALQHASAVQMRAALEDRVRIEVRDAVLLVAEIESQLETAREMNAFADEDFRRVDLRHNAGRASTEDVLEAADARAAARQRELQARIAYWIAWHRLAALVGGLSPENPENE